MGSPDPWSVLRDWLPSPGDDPAAFEAHDALEAARTMFTTLWVERDDIQRRLMQATDARDESVTVLMEALGHSGLPDDLRVRIEGTLQSIAHRSLPEDDDARTA